MNREERALARKRDVAHAGEVYASGLTLEQVAEEMGVSYGKAHALVKESDVPIRARGARFVAPDRAGATPPDAQG